MKHWQLTDCRMCEKFVPQFLSTDPTSELSGASCACKPKEKREPEKRTNSIKLILNS